jgi:hypothetical protein
VDNEGSASADFGLLVEAYSAASADELNMIFGSERVMLKATLVRGPRETVVYAD